MAAPSLPGPPVRLRRSLLAWYRRSRRDLPWRGSTDPYRIWVSEVMLQQTRVAAAIPFYEGFIERFPDLRALAASDPQAVLHAWAGLGYYSRARNLLAGARWVVEHHGGEFPRDPAEARRVPGVGPYTVGAVLSIAYGVRLPAVDANAERVLARLVALEGDLSRSGAKRHLRELATALLPARRPGDLNQALMELGALVCIARGPRCGECPWAAECQARAAGVVERIPARKARAREPVRRTVAVVAERRGRFLVGRRPDGGLWGGMWEFPWGELREGESALEAAPLVLSARTGMAATRCRELPPLRHGLMEHTVELAVVHVTARGTARPLTHEELAWVSAGDLARYPMPRPHLRIAAMLPASDHS
jgi:A/G-specific adenine glycosylase